MSFSTAYRQLLVDARAGAPARPAAPPPLRRRLPAWLRQGALERRLLAGEPVAAGSLLAVRAWQLTRPRARVLAARTFDALLRECERPAPGRGAAVPVCREQVAVARDELVLVLERLRDPRPLRARGMAMLRQLVSDGDGPLYAACPDGELWRALRRAAIALG